MALSQRVLSGSIVKGSTAIVTGIDHTQEDADGYVQGYNVKDFSVLSNSLTYKIRGNSGVIRTIRGNDLNPEVFNDAYSPINLTAYDSEGVPTGSVRIPAPAIEGRLKERINHFREQRDLGQSQLYEDGTAFFEAVNTENGLEVIGATGPMDLPASLVDHSSVSSLDGKIEPLGVQSAIDRSTIDLHPYNPRGVRGSMGIDHDAFNRSYQLIGGTYKHDNENPTVPYMDAPEVFAGVTGSGEPSPYIGINLPGAFYQDTSKIKPFSDISGDVEKYVNFGPGKTLSSDPGQGTDWTTSEGCMDIKRVLISSSSFTVDNTLQNFDKLTNGGFDFPNSLGTDSLVYGGLLKG